MENTDADNMARANVQEHATQLWPSSLEAESTPGVATSECHNNIVHSQPDAPSEASPTNMEMPTADGGSAENQDPLEYLQDSDHHHPSA